MHWPKKRYVRIYVPNDYNYQKKKRHITWQLVTSVTDWIIINEYQVEWRWFIFSVYANIVFYFNHLIYVDDTHNIRKNCSALDISKSNSICEHIKKLLITKHLWKLRKKYKLTHTHTHIERQACEKPMKNGIR